MPVTDTGPAGAAGPAKAAAAAALERELDSLLGLSRALHAHPELSFEEERSSALTAGVLSEAGFDVTVGVAELPTAFDARFGSGSMVVAVCAEYDALPGIGHACGHNLIAAMSAGAGIALSEVADDLDLTVRVIGTPAEEGGGGKVLLLDRGAFDGVHLAMMAHPWPEDRLEATCLAVSHFDVTFEGRAAHASAAPWKGINAGDAMVVAQVAIGLLRQQLPPGDQVHGIVTGGGEAANIVPATVTGRFMCRSTTLERLGLLEPRVRACFEAGALATGAGVSFTSLAPDYSHMASDPVVLAAFRANAEALGRTFAADDRGEPPPTLSTDMANVSLAIPTIHPMLGIDAGGAVNHQPAFADACVTPSADAAVHDGAVALAWTAVDAAVVPELRDRLLGRIR